MVAGFSYPDGDPGGLDGVARSLGTLSGDLTTEKGNVSSGVATTLRTWEATRSGDFEDAGRGITGTLDGASGVVDAAQEQVSGFARRLRNAREDIDELERQAQRQLDRMDGLDSEDDDYDDTRTSVDTEVARLRRQAQEIRDEVERDATSTAGALDAGTEILVPEAGTLSPDQVARRVHGSTGVSGTSTPLAAGELSTEDAWEALSGVSEPAASLGDQALESWLGFRPPVGDGSVSMTLFALGQVQFGTSTVASWMADQRYSHFRPIDAAGRTVSPNMGFWQRLRHGAGRFPTARGLSPWQRARGFDPRGHFSARPWHGGQASRWSTAGKWLGRGGTVLTAATSAWDEWNESANYPTDERVGRTVTVSATTTGGALLGAKGGAWAGGAIGTAICPGVGTVIGAGVGALIGGFVGSQAGAWVGDRLKDVGGDIADGVGDALDAAGDFVDDITPW
ncbi:hypothetical protein BJF86_11870 [Serinicoccus sp. CNJ-927]|uniref:hypothetical protein n=1 Tax=Serinicoccus sp. CNJ-927 TaxID=1904970 RepID=UPI00095D597A|nr:hypothetical protein [Serinicoccus sp. CNJ-927]OLT44645.1 hypothetical protein BJF86_11870 [Serinicoccus sp. CNJ-927]